MRFHHHHKENHMTTEVINFQTEQEWLGLRTKDITSTDISALFGLSPYKTAFELFHEKRGGNVHSFQASERMRWGNRLESAIAYGAAEDHGFNVQPLKVYMRNPVVRIGSSFDFEILSDTHGKGIMEIKNVDSLVYKRSWTDDGNGNIEAPEHIELQVQHQMEVSGYEYCAIVAMVGGNSTKVVYRKRDHEIGAAIRAKTSEFWQRVEANEPPSADYSKDADLIAQLYSQVNVGEVYDAKQDDIMERLVEQYVTAKQRVAENEKLVDIYKAQIIERVGAAERVVGRFGSIAMGRTKDTPAKVITADMVGTSMGGRKGYRQFVFTAAK
jgi:putative phage-type endonuclease